MVSTGLSLFSGYVYFRPANHALMWTSPWVIAIVLLTLELAGNYERDLMVVSSVLILFFYISCTALELFFFFETAGLPLLLCILLVGRQPQKVEAAKYILFYIAFAALPLLYIISISNTTVGFMFSSLGLLVVMPFLAKMPAYLLHSWLPKAHVEASTPGSILLAGSVMKLGSYGMLRWCLLPSNRVLGGAVVGLGVVLLAASLLRGTDSKTLVAYSRVLHIAVGLVA